MIDWLRKALGIKSDLEVANGVADEPTIKNARRALRLAKKYTGISDDILEDYEEAEADRLRKVH